MYLTIIFFINTRKIYIYEIHLTIHFKIYTYEASKTQVLGFENR